MKKIIILSVSIMLTLLGITLFFLLKSEEVVNTNAATFAEEYQGTDFIIAPHMYDALTDTQRQNLSIAWGEVQSAFQLMAQIGPQINASENIDNNKKLRVSQLVSLSTINQNTVIEIKHEIESPAESLDEKIAAIISISFVLNDLSAIIKNDLSDTSLKKQANKLDDATKDFFEKINKFKSVFFSAIQLKNAQKKIPDEIVNAFEEMNETRIAKFSDYDGRRFFNEIKDNIHQKRKEYGLK